VIVEEGLPVAPRIRSELIPQAVHGLWEQLRRCLPVPLRDLLKKSGAAAIARRWLSAHPRYEPDICQAVERIVQSGWTCADVGAHVGVITQLLARLVGPAGLVVAFEAHPENARLLCENVNANGWGKRVRVENLAVTDGSCGRVWLFAGRECRPSEWNIVGHDVDGAQTRPEMEVPAKALDDYFPPGSRLNLVKIDVEGAEAQVLAGMRRLLREARPVAIIEFHDEAGWAGRKELLAAAYDLYDMSGRRLDPVRDVQRVYHCLALPRDIV
jgi:FkbM family methyltransferase